MGDFRHPSVCWRDNTAGHRQTRLFFKYSSISFLTQVIEDPLRKDALLDLIHTEMEEIIEDVKIESYQDHEMIVKFWITRGRSRAKVRS